MIVQMVIIASLVIIVDQLHVALEALENVDLIMFMLDGTQEISTGDDIYLEHQLVAKATMTVKIN